MTKKADPKTKQPQPAELNDEQLSGVAGGAKRKAAPAAPAAPAPMM